MKKKLKILMVDKYYFIKGGAERYYFELKKILEANGHDVIPFSMKHPRNYTTEYNDYFVDNIEFNYTSQVKKAANSLKIAGRIIYSLHAKKQIEALIEKIRPDVAHIHMIDHQISPSILHSLKKYDIPVVQTVHQYKLVCPNYRLYNPRKNEICEKCLTGNVIHPIFQRCHKNSAFAGSIIAIEALVHKYLKVFQNVDIFHVPSNFMKKKLLEGGIEEDKITKLYYTINLDEYPFTPNYQDYFVYYGRLAEEKGILTLLTAMKSISESNLYIVGEGPQKEILESFCRNNSLKNVKFLGLKNGPELNSIISNSRFVVVPSEWYDNSPLVIYESFSMGKPVIGSDIGGISELIDHGKNGLLFEAGNANDLAESIQMLLNGSDLIQQFGVNARQKAEREFSPSGHYEQILAIYHELLN